MKIVHPSVTRDIVRTHDIFLKRGLGQNLLVDENFLHKMGEAARLEHGDTVLEIGAGIGALTQYLADIACQVVAVEVDRRIAAVLSDLLGDLPNVKIIHADALKLDLRELMGSADRAGVSWKLVANLPYCVAAQILVNSLETSGPWESMTVMVQREVGERLAAEPGTKRYGFLSVIAQYHSRVDVVARVPRTAFFPQPDVDSAIVRLGVGETRLPRVQDYWLFKQVVRGAFVGRRKMLLNSLRSYEPLSEYRPSMERALEEASIDRSRRGETLSVGEFVRLSDLLSFDNRGSG